MTPPSDTSSRMQPDEQLSNEWMAWDDLAPPPPVFVVPTRPLPSRALDMPPMRRIRKRLQHEIVVVGVFTTLLLVVAALLGPRMYLPLTPAVVLMLAYLAGCVSGLLVLRRPPPAERPVLEHLGLSIQHLRRLAKAYLYVSAAAFPFGMFAGLALSWTDLGAVPISSVDPVRMWKGAGLSLGVSLLLAWPLQWMYHWVIRRTYAKDLDQWEAAIAELTDETSPAP